ncbi:Uncharacterized protein HZ326_16409 [Fusarium oxysporum f. sp. albedinis]|nr:Uncharacterized protein HZ326_16409 [Fusarium oxysporum f. sp. albedinis]
MEPTRPRPSWIWSVEVGTVYKKCAYNDTQSLPIYRCALLFISQMASWPAKRSVARDLLMLGLEIYFSRDASIQLYQPYFRSWRGSCARFKALQSDGAVTNQTHLAFCILTGRESSMLSTLRPLGGTVHICRGILGLCDILNTRYLRNQKKLASATTQDMTSPVCDNMGYEGFIVKRSEPKRTGRLDVPELRRIESGLMPRNKPLHFPKSQISLLPNLTSPESHFSQISLFSNLTWPNLACQMTFSLDEIVNTVVKHSLSNRRPRGEKKALAVAEKAPNDSTDSIILKHGKDVWSAYYAATHATHLQQGFGGKADLTSKLRFLEKQDVDTRETFANRLAQKMNEPDTNEPDTNEPDTNEPDTNEPTRSPAKRPRMYAM